MNLLTDKWIVVRRASGAQDCIAPYEITANYQDNPVEFLNAPRADFNGALAQFLIGLLQTSCHDLTEKQWNEWIQRPPSPEILKKLFAPFSTALEVNGNGPRFMQDFDLPKGEQKTISALLIEQPGQQTLDLNADHFIKRDLIKALCMPCAITALFTLQVNAPAGGVGHRTSLRGGGPLTTLIFSDEDKQKTLWHMLWLNVVPLLNFQKYFGRDTIKMQELPTIFPWLAPTCTSEKESSTIRPNDCHPFQCFWSMPRRIRLNFENTSQGKCDICAKESDTLIQYYITKNYGINYSDTWIHPLTPYRTNENSLPLPMHPQPDGIGYKYWQAIVMDKPAFAIRAFDQRLESPHLGKNLKVWSFGYDMDNMKARCWYESIMPFYFFDPNIKDELDIQIRYFLNTAKLALSYLRTALSEVKEPFKPAELSFWQRTEKYFYEILRLTIQALEVNLADGLDEIKKQWLKVLQTTVKNIFDDYVDLMHPELDKYTDIIKARKALAKKLAGPKIYQELSLEREEKTSESRS